MATSPVDTYREEALDLLKESEQCLIELENDTENDELINRVFRGLHTIKGSGSMFGFQRIADFTHEVESVFDLVRKNSVFVDKNLIDITLSSLDYIKNLLTDEDSANAEDGKELVEKLSQYKTSDKKKITEEKRREEETSNEDTKKTYRIIFKPGEEIFVRGVNPIKILDEIREMGDFHIFAHTAKVPCIDELDAEKCFFWWSMILTTSHPINSIKDVFIFVDSYSEIKIDLLDDEAFSDETPDYKKLGEILLERGDISKEDLMSLIENVKPLGERAREKGIVNGDSLHSALEEQKYIRNMRSKRKEVSLGSSIRVKNSKLDDLANLVSELVTLQARLHQYSNIQRNSDLSSISEQFDRLITELRDNTMSIRMVPIGETFSSFNRLVRDLSHELGKEIEIETSGSETELDKSLIEHLKDPVVHILRNSIDHGIESPEEREKKGKNRAGRILLSAEHEGANVVITIKDDGAGLNAEKIRKRALERSIINSDTMLDEKEIYSLIFMPGFSTAEKTTSVSGRGVGMDVVKSNVERLRGSVDLKSDAGKGTKITIKLPLTLAIIDGLLVTIDGNYYVINLSVVDECVELETASVKEDGAIAKIRGELVPYLRFRSIFEMPKQTSELEEIVITKIEGQKVGFVVDKVIGQHQTVIKSMGRVFQNIDEISGATILGDGTIALILDVNKIAREAENKLRKRQEEIASLQEV